MLCFFMGINIPKIWSLLYIIECTQKTLKWTHWLFGNDNRISKLSKLYLTAVGIIKQSFQSMGQF